ncbi:MAG: hypothetical protein RLZZ188_1027 [Verrucomicrobiota bacterium]|jgi:hypothetical protein
MAAEFRPDVAVMFQPPERAPTLGQGDPADWAEPGPIPPWLREKLIEANIPFHAVACLNAMRKNLPESVDFLLEHLPMTPDEIDACR